MKSTWSVVIAVCGAAALVLIVRAWRPNATPDTTRRNETAADAGARRALDERSAGGGSAVSSGAAAKRGRATRQAAGAGGPAQHAEQGRDRAPGRPGVTSRLSEAQNGARRDRGERAGDPAESWRRPELPHTQPDLPQAADGGVGDGGGLTDELAPEPIPDVAYESGPDHVFDTGSRVEVTNVGTISGDAGTISFWIEPEWERHSQDDASFVQLGERGLLISKNGNFLRFGYADRPGEEYGGRVDIGDWQAGDWHHVIGTWRGGQLSLYVDGGQIFANHPPARPDLQSDTKLYVGSALPSDAPTALGQLSYLTVLNRDASSDEVKQMFESGGAPIR